ncbi:peptidoglycan recognition family protein [Pseudomonas sp. GCM10022188]|uniref:peptidoglycan recognition protein family protein n=1 Tax=Pseudomonas TaxID=286 RepID=UPI001E5E7F47|nr:peptidoglycan recognition family protein [Pseudomonas oryzagri]MCC6076708.1 peptidoglycan recognition protein family protein [Pseudomonas oryzagri]
MTGIAFKTTAKAQEVKPGQPLVPVAITVNDRAATREAIIRKVRSLGHQFVERSGWRAIPAKDGMESDWDYSMVAFHHAGRSYRCGHGGDQMRDTQEEQLDKKYDDIAYHFGIDCSGTIYEGRDIRLKGGSVRGYNTGVVGVVFLNNLTTAAEGDDIWSMGRETLEGFGVNTTNAIPPLQIEAAVNLLSALKSVFVIKRLGGHREFPGQAADGKICPGNIGMELVRNMRAVTGLLPPPSSL